jgi:hypothetical protein
MALLNVLMLLLKRLYCHKKYPECQISFKKHYDKHLLKQMSYFAGWSFLGFASSMISYYGQGVVLNVFFGTKINAAKGITDQVSGQLASFSNIMLKALNPMIVKSEGNGDRALVLKASMVGSKTAFFLLMLFYIPVIIEMPYIFTLWLKNVPEYATIFCRLLLIRNLIDQIFSTLSSTIIAVGDIAQFQLISSILHCLPLLITFFLFNSGFPPDTIYIVFSVYSLVYSTLILLFAKKTYNLPIFIFLKEVLTRCVFSFTLVYFLTYIPLLLMSEGIERLMTISLVSGITFITIVWFIGYSKEERSIFLKIIKRTLFKKI